MDALNLILLLTNVMFSSCYTIGGSVSDLTKCSKYHFEEKVLEKLIRLEIKMEMLEEKFQLEIKKFEESDKLRTISTETFQKNIAAEIKSQTDTLKEKTDLSLQFFEESEKNRTINFIALTKQMQAEFVSQRRTLESVVLNLTVQAENVSRELQIQQEHSFRGMERDVKLELNKIKNSERNRISMMATIRNESAENLKTNKEAFTALTENVMENVTTTLENILESEENRVALMELMRSEIIQNVSTMRTDFFNKLIDQQNTFNSTLQTYVPALISNMNDKRVAVSAGASGKTYSSGSTVLFPNVYTTHGISSSSVSALGTTGVFTCTRPGLYLISVFIMTNTHSTRANVYKNNNAIGYINFSLNGWYQTNSVTVLEHVSVNDTIDVKVYYNMYVHGGRQSVISILQITD